ncbi:hypothetical protein TcWFU_008121 [Taenia crassiceps]|uniref:Secreted protein n=1 Tax=Taenia crassiceps TaxID=6207 RepID=A0ABR4QBV5_9CEST
MLLWLSLHGLAALINENYFVVIQTNADLMMAAAPHHIVTFRQSRDSQLSTRTVTSPCIPNRELDLEVSCNTCSGLTMSTTHDLSLFRKMTEDPCAPKPIAWTRYHPMGYKRLNNAHKTDCMNAGRLEE